MSTVRNVAPAGKTEVGQQGAAMLWHVLRRQFARIEPARMNDLDQRVQRVLERRPAARAAAAKTIQRLERLSPERKRQLLSPDIADLPVQAPIQLDRLKEILDRLRDPQPPAGGGAEPVTIRVEFSHLICDEETGINALGSDEPYIAFTAITRSQLSHGALPLVTPTPVYEKVDSGERRPPSASETLTLFGAAVLDSDLMITASAFEHDLGDVSKLLSSLAELLLLAAFPLDLVASWLAIATVAAAFLTAAVAILAADDPIGSTQVLTLTPADAAALTEGTHRVILEPLAFGSVDGRYRAFLELVKL